MVEEEGVVDLKGSCGIGNEGKAVGWLSNSQLFCSLYRPRVYPCQELCPVGGLCLLDSVKVLVLEGFHVIQVGGNGELSAPAGGCVESTVE